MPPPSPASPYETPHPLSSVRKELPLISLSRMLGPRGFGSLGRFYNISDVLTPTSSRYWKTGPNRANRGLSMSVLPSGWDAGSVEGNGWDGVDRAEVVLTALE